MKRASFILLSVSFTVMLGVWAGRGWPRHHTSSHPLSTTAATVRAATQDVIASSSSPLISPPIPTSNPVITPAPDSWATLTAEQRLRDLVTRRQADAEASLAQVGGKLGNAVYLRIFKESSELELWLSDNVDDVFHLYKTWPIAAFSGTLGPKLREGDGQAPEGFYSVDKSRMNPLSNYHLSFNLGFPNAYDIAKGRTGSFLMVHGKDVSIGCYAMTDPVIEEIYLIAAAALGGGQAHFPVHCFPFRMTDARMAAARSEGSEWLDFWEELRVGYSAFEASKREPKIHVDNGHYVVVAAK